MISVVVYGRNDSHGYNLHKRVAISLNCIAEVLKDPDDEILYVDCNTSNDLPTFVEAIYDTLTPRTKSLMRVFRIRPDLYARMVGYTHLFATEPHPKNVGIRRSNPRNRWILTTNTDMIFVPRGNFSSLGEIVRDLPDGQYIAPRFELPEPLWESFPRSDPQAVIRACDELGPKLHLHEVAIRVPYMRFDSPGDFQLMPRKALFDIYGFEERMTHGWHADSNLCKRLCLYFNNRTESLAHGLRGYHCDHTRVATPLHQMDIKLENNLQQFVWDIEEAAATHQAETWGAPNDPIEELDLADGPPARYICALERTLGGPQAADYPTDANDSRNFVFYFQEHALPYLAGNLTVYPQDARFVYAGNNPHMLNLLSRCVVEMGFTRPMHYVTELLSAGNAPAEAVGVSAAGDGSQYQELLANYHMLIFDFGLDQSGLELGTVSRVTDWPRDLRYSLGAVARFLEACSEHSEAVPRMQVPDVLVLNANHYIFQRFIGHFLLSTEAPYPLHVRKGRPRVGQDRRYKGVVWKYNEDLMRSFFAYEEQDHSLVTVGPDHTIDFTSEGRAARYKDGHWGSMDYSGTWFDGYKAAILFAPAPSYQGDLVLFLRINEAFLGPEKDPMRLKVFFEGEFLTRWTIFTQFQISTCKVVLPARLLSGKKSCRLELHAENPQSAERVALSAGLRLANEDPRELSVKVQQATFTSADLLRYSISDSLDFTDKGNAAPHLNECWSQPDSFGVWTLGPEANVVLILKAPVSEPLAAIVTMNDVAVNAENPALNVRVDINGATVANWTLGPTRVTDERRILLPKGFPTSDPILISFHVETPRTPVQLNWSTWDLRPLGFRLNKFSVVPAGSLKYRLGGVIDLTDTGNSPPFIGDYLGTQWSLPDTYGSWTVGNAATMKISFDQPPTTGFPIAFVISECALSKAAPSLPVSIKANGRQVAEWTLGPSRDPHCRTINVPAESVAGQPELLLTFEIPTPRSPESLGWNSDTRPLGFRLARMVLGSATIEIPVFGERTAPKRSLTTRVIGLPRFALHVARVMAGRALRWWDER